MTFISIVLVVEGMHKKSLEAAMKLKDEGEEVSVNDSPDNSVMQSDTSDTGSTSSTSSAAAAAAAIVCSSERCDRKTESIALLRAKAHTYSVQVLEGFHDDAAPRDAMLPRDAA